MVPQQTMAVCPPYNSWVNSVSLLTLNPQSQQWWGLIFSLFFPRWIQILVILQIKTLINKLPLFLPALFLQLTPDNAPSPPPNPSTPFKVHNKSISYSTSLTCIFNHFYFQQVKHWTLSIEKRAIFIAFILIFYMMVINLSVIWWTFSPFDTITFTNLYRPLSLHLNVNSKICVIRCSI